MCERAIAKKLIPLSLSLVMATLLCCIRDAFTDTISILSNQINVFANQIHVLVKKEESVK